jgi:hypothetical protein
MMTTAGNIRSTSILSILTAGAICFAPAVCLGQTTLEFLPVADATLYESPATSPLANGAGEYVFIGENSLESTRRALLRFDVSAIPSGSTVVSVQLQLDVNQAANATPLPATLHAMTRAWCEGPTIPTGAQGGGAAAQSGDATWFAACQGSSAWVNAGGDFAPMVLSSQLVAGPAKVTWPSSPALVATVQQWIDAPASNLGLVLRGDESSAGTAKRLLSRETSGEGKRPRLIVAFTRPAFCDGIDFNNNGVFPEDQDVIDFFNVLSGAECTPCSDIDFNNNGVFPEDQDVIDFFDVLAGGTC